MRLDQFLKKVLLFKSRNQAIQAIKKGLVYINDRKAKPSCEVKPGDTVSIDYPIMFVKIRVIAIPSGNVAKRDREKYYQVLESRKKELIEEESEFMKWLMGDEFE